jgi:hypothetical protein
MKEKTVGGEGEQGKDQEKHRTSQLLGSQTE